MNVYAIDTAVARFTQAVGGKNENLIAMEEEDVDDNVEKSLKAVVQ